MTDKPKYRKVSPAEWIGLVGLFGAMAVWMVAFGGDMKQIDQNTEDIKELKQEYREGQKEIKDNVKDTNKKVDKIYELMIQQKK